MKHRHKAIVLAAGLGTRLRPLTAAVPKPLLPVWGESMLSRIVQMLRGWGVEDIVVNAHYLSDQIKAWCDENGCKVSIEEEILGTGGVLNPLKEWIGEDDFYLVNGDIVVEGEALKKSPLDEITLGGEVLAGAIVTDSSGPRTIEVESESKYVTCWRSPDPGWVGTYTYCGIAKISPKIFDYVKNSGFSSIVEAYEKAMMDGAFVKAVVVEDMLWTDAGTIDSYIELNTAGEDNAFSDLPQLMDANISEKVEFLGARGSDRIFFRSGDRLIVIYDDAKRSENAKYASHAKWLKFKGIPVPDVIYDNPGMKTTVFKWCGKSGFSLERYVKVVESLVAFNSLDYSMLDLEHKFDRDYYNWERELFSKHFLSDRHRMEMPEAVNEELVKVAERLLKEPLVLVHRDFQSTNIIWDNDRMAIIDFQGMREGAAAYDLASLLYDPYENLSDSERSALTELYAKKSGYDGIKDSLPYAAIQRLVQCIGAYARLDGIGKCEFSAHIVPAMERLLGLADDLGLDALGGLCESLIATETKRHEHHHCHHKEGCQCGHSHK